MKKHIVVTSMSALALTLAACDRAPTDVTRAPGERPVPQADGRSSTPSNGMARNSVQAKIDDAALTARVKSALLAAENVPGTAINVDTTAGTVTLRGQVASQTQVESAIQLARQVDGVQNVVNALTVGAG